MSPLPNPAHFVCLCFLALQRQDPGSGDTQKELDLGSGDTQKELDLGSRDTQNELDLGSGDKIIWNSNEFFKKVFGVSFLCIQKALDIATPSLSETI